MAVVYTRLHQLSSVPPRLPRYYQAL
uniref:Uncharacterized protein n=1 Tax=Rhizophora mucronata TaxID=61149 RepID=A0A2P2PHF1_RHIMU